MECRVLFLHLKFNTIQPSVILLNVALLNVIIRNAILLNATMLNVSFLIDVQQNAHSTKCYSAEWHSDNVIILNPFYARCCFSAKCLLYLMPFL
jgi:hypothetical protein